MSKLFYRSKTDATTVYYHIKNSYILRVLPRKVSQEVLRMVLKVWQSYYSAYREDKAFPSKFKVRPKNLNYQGNAGDRSNGRYVVIYHNQALSQKALKKGLIRLSKTNIYLKNKS
ncbi:MAG: hypothetical protein F6K25_01440 [Okeania sp. SIO2G4]|uniref:hypothetical protein n=1 Tax=unclassified Okeania TaxID=2634635 RepID=UPI0013CB9308|nr:MULTISPECIES: hypothetical protein [unclassified Okeania]NEP03554.1 hypothetical protein [Okeania sp. SIO4D6]NEP40600.1 hypothetical protein [Okeania sp. SIO2H7]NEQ89482.1 hypothetical protein [Okeania sp. SIO2G4]